MSSTSGVFTPADGDIAIEMLKAVFGNVFVQIASGAQAAAQNASPDILGTAFGFFNSGVLFFGSIKMTYVTIFGIANTAHDGEVLGRKWNTFYTPLRITAASGFLIPGASGYSAIQVTLLMCVYWSVGFASNMWGKVVDSVVVDMPAAEIVSSIVPTQSFDTFGLNVIQMYVCKYGLEQGINQVTAGSGAPLKLQFAANGGVKTVVKNDTSTTTTTTLSLDDPNWPAASDVCGRITITSTTFNASPPQSNSNATNGTYSGLQSVINSVQTDSDAMAALNAIQFKTKDIQQSYAINAVDQLGPVIQKIISAADTDGGVVKAAEVKMAVENYRNALTAEILTAITAQVGALNSAVSTRLKRGGWANAGALQREIARIKDSVKISSTVKIDFQAGTNSVAALLPQGDTQTAVMGVMSKYTSVMSAVVRQYGSGTVTDNSTSATGAPAIPTLPDNLTKDDFSDGGASVTNRLRKYFNYLPNAIMNAITHSLGENGTDPIMQIKDLGDKIAVFAESIIALKIAILSNLAAIKSLLRDLSAQFGIGVGAAAGDSVVSGVNEYVVQMFAMLTPSVWTLLYLGYFLGIWIPMIPFFIFTLGVIGWLVQVGEALAAAAIWMMMHLTPAHDDSFIGSQQQGYMLMFSLYLRPPLMILGLVFSMALMIPSLQFLNSTFMLSFRTIQTDSFTGLLSLAGYTMCYCFIVFSVLMLIFSLPQSMPDRILRYIGGGISDMGEQNSMGRVESGASGAARTAQTTMATKQAEFDRSRRDKLAKENEAANKTNGQRGGDHADAGPVGHGPESSGRLDR